MLDGVWSKINLNESTVYHHSGHVSVSATGSYLTFVCADFATAHLCDCVREINKQISKCAPDHKINDRSNKKNINATVILKKYLQLWYYWIITSLKFEICTSLKWKTFLIDIFPIVLSPLPASGGILYTPGLYNHFNNLFVQSVEYLLDYCNPTAITTLSLTWQKWINKQENLQ